MKKRNILHIVCQKKFLLQKGMSLFEIVVALALLGIIFVCVIQLFISGHFAIRQSDQVVNASNAGSELMERMRGLNFSDIPASSSYNGENGDEAGTTFPPLPYPSKTLGDTTYYFIVTTESVPNTGNRLIKVHLQVKWYSKSPFDVEKGGGNLTVERKISLTTVRASGE